MASPTPTTYRACHGRGRQLLVALELARGEGRERPELLPQVPRDDRHHRPACGLPRAPVVSLALRRRRSQRAVSASPTTGSPACPACWR
jgi:hypothetical protein